MSGKCHQMSKVAIKSLIRGPNIDEKHCAANQAHFGSAGITKRQWAKRWSWWWISRKKSSTRLFFALLDRCHSNAETVGLRFCSLHTGQKKVRAQQRTCYSRRQVANSYLQTPPSSLLSVSFWDLGSTLTFVVPLIYHQINKTLESL